jgi:hypothetical protein
MELLQSYLSRGRRFKDTDAEDLKDIWATAFKIYMRSRSCEGGQDFRDAG